MSEDLIVVGAGGFGREVVDVMHAVNHSAGDEVWRLRGIVDDSPTPANLERLRGRSIPHLGTLAAAIGGPERPRFVVGIGNPATRAAVSDCLEAAGFEPATLIHPTATLGSEVTIGPGSVICAGVRITTNISVGRHVHINLNATVGHDTVIGDCVSINPLASISGDCSLEDRVLIGVSAAILNGVVVRAGSTVGGGACVVREVSAETTVVGVPAAPLGRRDDLS